MGDVFFRDLLKSFMKDKNFSIKEMAKLNKSFKSTYIFHWATGAVLPNLENQYHFHLINPTLFMIHDSSSREKLRTPDELVPKLCIPCIRYYRDSLKDKRGIHKWLSLYFRPRATCSKCRETLPDKAIY